MWSLQNQAFPEECKVEWLINCFKQITSMPVVLFHISGDTDFLQNKNYSAWSLRVVSTKKCNSKKFALNHDQDKVVSERKQEWVMTFFISEYTIK